MAKANREKLSRVNFFDGQRVTEADLDDELIHHRGLVSSLTKDFHGSGIVETVFLKAMFYWILAILEPI